MDSENVVDRFEYSDGCTGNVTGILNTEGVTFSTSQDTRYCIRGVDSMGQASEWSTPYYFRIDKTAPILNYTLTKDDGSSYVSNTWSRRSVIRKFNAIDNESGVDIIQYNSNGSWNTENNAESFTFGEGVNKATYRVRDKVGNYSSPIELIFKIDWTPPTIEARYLSNFYLPTNNMVNRRVTQTKVDDEISGVNNATYYMPSAGSGTFVMNYNDATRRHVVENFALASTGNLSFDITATDVAGNTSKYSNTYHALNTSPMVTY